MPTVWRWRLKYLGVKRHGACNLLSNSSANERESRPVMSDSFRPDPMDYRVHGILQARILEWVAFPFCRESSQPRDQTQVSSIAGGFFTIEPPGNLKIHVHNFVLKSVV